MTVPDEGTHSGCGETVSCEKQRFVRFFGYPPTAPF